MVPLDGFLWADPASVDPPLLPPDEVGPAADVLITIMDGVTASVLLGGFLVYGVCFFFVDFSPPPCFGV